MNEDWRVELRKADRHEGEGFELLLAYGSGERDKPYYLIRNCFSLAQFEGEVARLKEGLNRAIEVARRELKALREKAAGGGAQTPETIWRRMEECDSQEAMFGLFNRLPDATRTAVAEYVFSQVSMFKGKGPLFAEHYDALSHRLD